MSHTNHRRKKKNKVPRGYVYIFTLFFILMFVLGGLFYIKKYGETKEHMALTDYFTINYENEAAVILSRQLMLLCTSGGTKSMLRFWAPSIYLNLLT